MDVAGGISGVFSGTVSIFYALAKWGWIAIVMGVAAWLINNSMTWKYKVKVYIPIGSARTMKVASASATKEEAVRMIKNLPCRTVETKARKAEMNGKPVIVMKKFKEDPIKPSMLNYAAINSRGKPDLSLIKIRNTFFPLVVGNPTGEFEVVEEDMAFWQVQVGKNIREIAANKSDWMQRWMPIIQIGALFAIILALVVLFKRIEGVNALPGAVQEGVKEGIKEGVQAGMSLARSAAVPGAPPA